MSAYDDDNIDLFALACLDPAEARAENDAKVQIIDRARSAIERAKNQSSHSFHQDSDRRFLADLYEHGYRSDLFEVLELIPKREEAKKLLSDWWDEESPYNSLSLEQCRFLARFGVHEEWLARNGFTDLSGDWCDGTCEDECDCEDWESAEAEKAILAIAEVLA